MAENTGAIDSISIEIGASASEAVKKINDVAKALNDLKKVQSSPAGKSDMLTKMKSMSSDAVSSLSKIELLRMKLAALRQEMGKKMAFGQLDAKGIANAALQIKNVQAQIDKTILSEAKAAAKAAAKQSGKELVTSDTSVASSSLPQLSKEARSAASGMDRLKEVAKGATSWLHKSGDAAKKSSGGLAQFAASLKRIAMYRVLRTIIKEITQAFQEGLKNAYAYSQTIGSSISQALDSISGASLQMKNQLGAALGELLVTIRPILEAIIGLITRVADALSQFFAILGGRMVYHKATDSVKQWSNAATGAAKAAKEWKNQLMGFDEINRLEEPADSGGGGAGGDNGMGNWELSPVTLDLSWLDKYRDATKEWLDSLDWEPLTKAWETLKQRILEFAKVVDSALYWAYTNVLLPLGKWVIEEAAPASVELLASMFNLLSAVLEKVGPLLQWLYENILKPIAEFIGNVFVKVIQWLKDAFDGLAEKIRGAESIHDFFNSLNGKEFVVLAIATAIGTLLAKFAAIKAWGAILKAVFFTIGDAMVFITSPVGIAVAAIAALITIGYLVVEHWDQISAWLKNLWAGIVEYVTTYFGGLVDSIQRIFDGIKKIFSGLIDFIAGVFTGDWSRAWNGVIQIFTGIYQTFTGIIDSMFGWISSLIDAVSAGISWIRGLFDHIGALGQVKMVGPAGGVYASGGFPEDGLFMANHNELVGSFSNGRTAVANNEQITEGIANAVYGAFMSAFSQTGGSGGSSQPVNIYLDGKIIANSTTKYQNQYARVRGV